MDDSSGAGGSKLKLLMAVALVLAATAGYLGWHRTHLSTPQPTIQNSPVAPAPTPAAPEIALGTNSEQQASTTPASEGQTPPAEINEAQQSEGSAAPAKPSPGKSTIVAFTEAPVPKTAPVTKTPEPIVVKNELSKPAQPKPVQETAAPGVLEVASNPDDKALSGLVNSTPVNVPKPVPQTLKLSQGVSQGLLMKKVQPVYPPQALQLRIQGSVVLQASISKEGNITNVKSLSGDPVLARAAIDAVRQWKYKPYYLNGEPVEIQTQVTVNFKLP
jgi:protein TonB